MKAKRQNVGKREDKRWMLTSPSSFPIIGENVAAKRGRLEDFHRRRRWMRERVENESGVRVESEE